MSNTCSTMASVCYHLRLTYIYDSANLINMSKYLLASLVTFLLTLHSFAQIDSLLQNNQLTFNSSFEKNVFAKSTNNEQDYFNGFMVYADYDTAQIASYKHLFDNKIKTFAEGKRPKSNSKYLKKVYDFVHEEFLRKYETETYFHQIFKNGRYNCVTACALYGMTFTKLDIPFVIKETPTHVYIIAYPDAEQIGIETTDPIGGFKTFSIGFKENFVNQLVALKLIDISELSDGMNAVFDRYYFSSKELGLAELIGIQYYNHGITELQDRAYLSAYHDLEKAYFLYPSDNIKETLTGSCLLALSEANFDNWDDVNLLAMAITLNHPNFTDQQQLSEFSRFLQKQLIDKNDTVFVDQAYEKITMLPLDEDLEKDITFLYNYERARKLYNRGNYKLALPYAKEAYRSKPENSDSENLLVNTIQNTMVTKVYSDQEMVAIIEDLLEEYPSLKTHGHLGELRSRLYLIAMHDAFEQKKISQALELKNSFEEFLSQNNHRYDEYSLGKAYSEGIMYYFRKGSYRNARNLLNDGLKLAPTNYDLKMRKYYLDRAGN